MTWNNHDISETTHVCHLVQDEAVFQVVAAVCIFLLGYLSWCTEHLELPLLGLLNFLRVVFAVSILELDQLKQHYCAIFAQDQYSSQERCVCVCVWEVVFSPVNNNNLPLFIGHFFPLPSLPKSFPACFTGDIRFPLEVRCQFELHLEDLQEGCWSAERERER